jgi:hypothetical protein
LLLRHHQLLEFFPIHDDKIGLGRVPHPGGNNSGRSDRGRSWDEHGHCGSYADVGAERGQGDIVKLLGKNGLVV